MIKKTFILFCLAAILPLAYSQSSNGRPCRTEPTVKDYDGNVYTTVQIGKQCWLRENLRTTHYANGTPIAFGNDTMSTTTPYRYYPNADEKNVPVYGYLYNWAAVMHGCQASNLNPSGVQGICPNGWHVPSEAEWRELVKLTGKRKKWWRNNLYAVPTLCDNLDYGYKSYDYVKIWNKTGLSLRCSGAFLGYYYSFKSSTVLWTSTDNQSKSAVYLFINKYAQIEDYESLPKSNALPVRCLRDK